MPRPFRKSGRCEIEAVKFTVSYFKPRLIAAGGDPSMVEIVNGSFRLPTTSPG